MTDLVTYLRQTTEFFEKQGHPRPFERFILDHGKDYSGRKRPRGMRKQTNCECFKNSTRFVLEYPSMRYCEGFAIHDGLFPMHHAWAIDPDDKLIDLTWKRPERSEYRGVVIPREKLIITMLKHEVYGAFYPSEMLNLDLLKELTPVSEEAPTAAV